MPGGWKHLDSSRPACLLVRLSGRLSGCFCCCVTAAPSAPSLSLQDTEPEVRQTMCTQLPRLAAALAGIPWQPGAASPTPAAGAGGLLQGGGNAGKAGSAGQAGLAVLLQEALQLLEDEEVGGCCRRVLHAVRRRAAASYGGMHGCRRPALCSLHTSTVVAGPAGSHALGAGSSARGCLARLGRNWCRCQHAGRQWCAFCSSARWVLSPAAHTLWTHAHRTFKTTAPTPKMPGCCSSPGSSQTACVLLLPLPGPGFAPGDAPHADRRVWRAALQTGG